MYPRCFPGRKDAADIREIRHGNQTSRGLRMKKIAFIGAGSFGFTRTLVRDILTFPAFQDAEIALMDIDRDRLDAGSSRLYP